MCALKAEASLEKGNNLVKVAALLVLLEQDRKLFL